jgi:ADP-ribose pyrophosphatase YjhB (NUDIX family)
MKNQPNISTKVIIVREDGKLLALRRSKTCPRRPFSWDLPGGDVEFGEELEASVKREIQEEAGVAVEKVELLTQLALWRRTGIIG